MCTTLYHTYKLLFLMYALHMFKVFNNEIIRSPGLMQLMCTCWNCSSKNSSLCLRFIFWLHFWKALFTWRRLLPHLGLIRHFLRRLALVYFVTASSSEGKTPHCATKFRQHKCSVVCVCVVWGDKQYKQMWLFQLIYRFQRQFLQSYFP